MTRKPFAFTLALLSAAALSLTGCDTWSGAMNYIRADNASVCPDANILANTSVLPAFDPAKGADPSNVVYTVRMTGLKSRCDYTKRNNTIDAAIYITVQATRPAGGDEATYKVPYYVAVTSNGEIVDKKAYWYEVQFPRGVSEITEEVTVDSIEIDVARDRRSYDYHLLTGFQLTQGQIDYNKKMGQYWP